MTFKALPEPLRDLPITDPWPTEALDRAARRQNYPCRRLLDPKDVRGERCDARSTYHARGNEARCGHVCSACWQGFEEAERALYAYVGLNSRTGFTFEDLRSHAQEGNQP